MIKLFPVFIFTFFLISCAENKSPNLQKDKPEFQYLDFTIFANINTDSLLNGNLTLIYKDTDTISTQIWTQGVLKKEFRKNESRLLEEISKELDSLRYNDFIHQTSLPDFVLFKYYDKIKILDCHKTSLDTILITVKNIPEYKWHLTAIGNYKLEKRKNQNNSFLIIPSNQHLSKSKITLEFMYEVFEDKSGELLRSGYKDYAISSLPNRVDGSARVN